MSAKKTETKIEKIEREYTIPLREKCRVVPRYKKTPKAVKTIKEFLVRHMKIYDRDLRKIKIDSYLNEYLWFRGIKKPPHKVKVKAIKEGEIVKVELVDYPDKLKFKKAREERLEKKAKEIAGKKKKEKQEEPKETEEEKREERKDEQEKKSALVEAGKEMEKAMAKKEKHNVKQKIRNERQAERKVYDIQSRGR